MTTIETSFGLKTSVLEKSRAHPAQFPTRRKSFLRYGSGISNDAVNNGSTIKQAVFLFTVTCIGLSLSIYLSWIALSSSLVAGCGGGLIFDCSHVMQSKWSSFMGIPVGVFAAGLYLSIATSLAISLTSDNVRARALAARVFTFGSLAAGFAAVWFIALQVFVLQHLCTYCLAAHACGLILSASVLWLMPLEIRSVIKLALVSTVGIAVLATGQIMAEAPATFQVEQHELEIFRNQSPNQSDTDSDSSILEAPGFESSNTGTSETGKILMESSEDKQTKPDDQMTPMNKPAGHPRLSGNYSLATIQLGQFCNALILTTLVGRDGPVHRQEPAKHSDQAGVQSQAEPADEKNAEPRLIGVHGGKIRLNMAQWPVVGNANAKHVFVEMFDYTCSHCRQNHKFVKEAREQLGDQLAVLTFSVPMNMNCNSTVLRTIPVHVDACEISRLSVAVWRVSPNDFAEFHEWLFTGDNAPSAASARIQAEILVGKEKLAEELAGNVAAEYVAKQVELYKKVGAGTVPKLLFTGTTVTGNISSTESLIKVVRQQPTDLQPVSSGVPKLESKNGKKN